MCAQKCSRDLRQMSLDRGFFLSGIDNDRSKRSRSGINVARGVSTMPISSCRILGCACMIVFDSKEVRVEELRRAEEHPYQSVSPSDYTDEGGLMAYAVDYDSLQIRMAHQADQIFKGAKPGEIPIQQAMTYRLIISLKTAQGLRLTIPQSLLARADEVIE